LFEEFDDLFGRGRLQEILAQVFRRYDARETRQKADVEASFGRGAQKQEDGVNRFPVACLEIYAPPGNPDGEQTALNLVEVGVWNGKPALDAGGTESFAFQQQFLDLIGFAICPLRSSSWSISLKSSRWV
jgi:hypothetical protein